MLEKKIKVLVVDDSLLFRKVLIDSLQKNNDIEVVGYAVDDKFFNVATC